MNAQLSPNWRWLANLGVQFYNALMSLAEWEFLEGKRLPWPVPWQVLFGRPAPLLVEIGFGNGQFLLDLARRSPAANIVGLEISQPSLRKTQRKISARDIPYMRLIHASAEQALRTHFVPGSVSGIYINFPDPWPKASHQNRRLVAPGFLDLVASRMHEGAILEIATDDASYAAEITQHLISCRQFENQRLTPYTHEDDTRVRTKYEWIAREENRLCHYFKWRRNAVPAARHFPIPRELEMPHVTLRPNPSLEQIASSFELRTHSGEWGTIRFVGLYEDRDHDALLVDTYVDELALTQRLGIAMRARGDGSLVIGVHEIGYPRATPGVHHAIRCLASDLQERFPLLAVVASNLMAP